MPRDRLRRRAPSMLALRHGERVVREVDLLLVLVPLVHREVDDPAEARTAPCRSARVPCRCGARGAGELRGLLRHVAGEEHGVAAFSPACRAIAACASAGRNLAIGPLPTSAPPSSRRSRSRGPARPRRAPSRSACRRSERGCVARARRRDRAHHAAASMTSLKALKRHVSPRERVGDVGDDDGVAQVRLVGAVLQHRVGDRGCVGKRASPACRRRTPRTRRAAPARPRRTRPPA